MNHREGVSKAITDGKWRKRSTLKVKAFHTYAIISVKCNYCEKNQYNDKNVTLRQKCDVDRFISSSIQFHDVQRTLCESNEKCATSRDVNWKGR